ncbi:hypothetical protein SDRG_01274 [Saprolegnia diclina VS20]|uniref:Uncharacterized protein n=1 Tax=Saprolegnia diclina (strain VS20) TaxID=1156394 RepID=T0QSZ5_SAPDV|nr:hypothetical protein SDRG_01274 [Saprolegnia diclina VS20]EQC41299.1 hypothetical protein SDRG_01274 [Saprolegnia diclina VS20]|eukprot:XP_008605013.1 hypothetical protein SDRG_01274 [Saprolegnia diclina VS20]
MLWSLAALRQTRLYDGVGLTYVVGSVLLGLAALYMLRPYMENDYFWPGLFASNVSTLVATTFNLELTLLPVQAPSSTPLDLIARHLTSSDEAGQLAAYARKLVYEELTTAEAAIVGLRRLETQNIIFMVAQYCWVDFEKRWVMAHTAARAARCWARDVNNGAVYLESVARNTPFRRWVESTQGMFDVRIGNAVRSVSPMDGPTWLDTMLDRKWSTLDEEVGVWADAGVTRFALQYANQFQIGIDETITIQNALGLSSTFRLKSLAAWHRDALWTTDYMYAGLQNDFNAIGANQSLVLNSTLFFGAFDPTQLEYYNLGYPLAPVYAAAHDALGFLANIDLRWVPLPKDLNLAVQRFRALVLHALETTPAFATAFAAIPSLTLHPTPPQWTKTSLRFYGGSPMCGYVSATDFVQESFGFDDACGTQRRLSVGLTPMSALFATALTATTAQPICALALPDEQALCYDLLRAATAAKTILGSLPNDLQASSALTLDIRLLQFVQDGANPLHLQTQAILEPSWAFFGHGMLYDWAMNQREVVSFEGDVASYTVMSYATPGVALPAPPATLSLGMYMWYCAVIVSAAIAGVGLLVVLLFSVHRPRGSDWFVFNRVVSAVWSNRSLLLTRAFACSLSLGTAPVKSSASQRLVDSHRSLYESSLFAGESVWITYVVQDVFTPLTLHGTRTYAPWSSHLAFLIVFLLDVLSPVNVDATLRRDCYLVNMDRNVFCNSGHIVLGSWQRVLTVLVVNVGVVLVGILFERCVLASGEVPEPSLLLSSAAVAYLQPPPPEQTWEASLNPVTAFMAGVVNIKQLGWFDIKLWRFINNEKTRLAAADMLPQSIKLEKRDDQRQTSYLWKVRVRYNSVVIAVALLFMAMTFTSNILYLELAQSFLANDFGWEGFAATGVYAFVANQFNEQLLLHGNSTPLPFEVASVDFSDWRQRYNDSSATIISSFHAPRRQLLEPSMPLSTFVVGLRSLNPCKLPWMSTQLCWVDFERTWSLASSSRRVARCQAQYTTNGAVYLETALRNIPDRQAWESCWGTSFEIGIGRVLRATNHGQRWLADTAAVATSVEDEVAYWERHGIAAFAFRWQNYKTLGLLDSIEVTSALGYTQPLAISHSVGAYHMNTQTSLRFYWTFASDLWAIATNATLLSGKSLIYGDADFAFANVSSQSVLQQNLTIIAPLSPGLQSLHDSLGPFGSIDMVFVTCPSALRTMYGRYLSSLSALLLSNATARTAFAELPSWPFVLPVPTSLMYNASIAVVGGNMMCGDDCPPYPAYYGLYRPFGMTNPCHAIFSDNMATSNAELIFAFLGLYANHANVAIADICGLNAAGSGCPVVFEKLSQFAMDVNATAFAPLAPVAHELQRLVLAPELNVSAVQYIALNGAAAASLFTINLLDPSDVPWTFFGWCYLFEWVAGHREVVAFQGDSGAVAAISARTAPRTMAPDPSAIPVTFSSLSQAGNLYISYILICIAGSIALLILTSPTRDVEGMNLFALNRIIGHVWAGRTFLVLRSVTAMWMLNTSPLKLLQVDSVTRLDSPPLTWYMTILAASEASWLVYVLNDVFSCITQQYTSLYAGRSSLGTTISVTIWTFLHPQHYAAALHRRCDLVDVDFELHCVSGSIALGDPLRLGVLCGIALANIIVWYQLAKWYAPHQPSVPIETLLLSSQSFYLMHWHDRERDGVYYLDTMSAVMAGLLSLSHKNRRYVFDVKAWRLLVLPPASAMPHAIPLSHH